MNDGDSAQKVHKRCTKKCTKSSVIVLILMSLITLFFCFIFLLFDYQWNSRISSSLKPIFQIVRVFVLLYKDKLKVSVLNKLPRVPRVPKCPSAWVPKCSSAFRVPECPSAWDAKCPNALRVSESPSAQVPCECPTALSVLSASSVRVPREAKCLSKSVSQLVSQSFSWFTMLVQ